MKSVSQSTFPSIGLAVRTSAALAIATFIMGIVPAAEAAIVTSGDVNPDPPVDGSNLRVGFGAAGSVEINGGSTFSTGIESNKIIFLGDDPDGYGQMLVTGSGSALETYKFTVGITSNADFTASDGAQINVVESFTLNNYNNAGNFALITGADTLMTVGGKVAINNGTVLTTMTIDDGAIFRMTGVTTAGGSPVLAIAGSGGSIAELNVRNGATLESTSNIHVGQYGNGTLNVSTGGLVTTDGSVTLGYAQGSSAEVNVMGGSALTTNGNFTIAYQTNTTAVVTVGGEGSGDVQAGATVLVGQGGNAELFVNAGGSVHAGANFVIAQQGSSNSIATVNGGSVSTDADILVSRSSNSTATMIIDGGGSAIAGDDVWVGYNAGSTGTLDVIDGTVTATDDFGVGALANSSGELRVGLNGKIDVGDVFVVANGDSASATVQFTLGHDSFGDAISGSVTARGLWILSGTTELQLTFDESEVFALGETFMLVDYASDPDSWNGGLFDNVADGGVLTIGEYDFLVDYDGLIGTGDYALTATVIPESSAGALLMMVLAAGCLFRRRSRRVDQAMATASPLHAREAPRVIRKTCLSWTGCGSIPAPKR